MKGKFYAPTYLKQLEDVEKNHQPYAALVVSTTGLDDSSFSEHSPTRVVLTQFEYDEEIKAYKEGLSFDKLVQAPQSAIDKAVENTSYDAFANGGIDRDAYIRGENVLSQAEFKKAFDEMITALQQDNTTLIVNNTSHALTYLDKIDCGNGVREMEKAEKTLDQVRLTQEYFQKEGISEKASLENLRNHFLSQPRGSFVDDKEKMRDFATLSKDEFLKSYSYLTEKEYDITAKDAERRNAKIVGGDNRIKVINQFATEYGRSVGVLEKEWQTHMRMSDKAYVEDLSQKGKDKYAKGDMHDKMSILTNSGAIQPEKILDGDSEYHKLMSAVQNDNDEAKKGLIIIHSATTGFDFSKKTAPALTGQPIQFAVAVYMRNEQGDVDFSRGAGKNVYIQANSKSVLAAIQSAERGKYDTFAEAGIDKEQYKAGMVNNQPVLSQQDATKTINDFFNKLGNLDDYSIVVMGGAGKNYSQSFTQTAMMNLGNFDFCDKPFIDFSQATKDYSFLARQNELENVLFGDNTPTKFGLKEIAEANGQPAPLSAVAKVKAVAISLNQMNEQFEQLFKPEKAETKEVEQKTAEPVKETAKPEKEVAVSSPAPELSEGEAFIEGNGYDNIAPVVNESVNEQEEIGMSPEEKAFINQTFTEMNENNPNIETTQHGKLYSDKVGDSVPIVEAVGIKQVGNVPVPHVSEAFKDAKNPDIEPPKPEKAETKERKREPVDFANRRKRTYSMENRENNKPAESPSVTPAPAQNDMTNKLMEMFAKQFEATTQQNEIMLVQAESYKQLADTVAQQNAVIAQQSMVLSDLAKQVLEQNIQLIDQTKTLLNERAENNKEAFKSPMERIGQLMKELDSIQDELQSTAPNSTAVFKSLSNARNSLAETRTSLERENPEKKNPIKDNNGRGE